VVRIENISDLTVYSVAESAGSLMYSPVEEDD
jgi:hypothetical protein